MIIHRDLSDILFYMDFEITQVCAALEAVHEEELVMISEAILHSVKFSSVKRPFDLTANISISSFFVKDLLSEGNNYIAKSLDKETDKRTLLSIVYKDVDSHSDEFQSLYQSIHRWVDVNFNGLDIAFNPKPIMNLMSFIQQTFNSDDVRNIKHSESGGTQRSGSRESLTTTPSKQMCLTATAQHLRLVLLRNGQKLVSLNFNEGNFKYIARSNGSVKISGDVSHIEMYDEISQSVTVSKERSQKEILSIQGEKLAEFIYETYNNTTVDYPGYDSLFDLKAESMKLYVSEKCITELILFRKDLSDMLLTEKKTSEDHSSGKKEDLRFCFRIDIKTPILIFPRDNDSDDVITAHLGQISMQNNFIPMCDESTQIDELINCIKAHVQEIKLTSVLFHSGKRQTLRIMEDVSVNLIIENLLNREPFSKVNIQTKATAIKLT
jgi:vacuolar protein sorting-associated protein 13A/C